MPAPFLQSDFFERDVLTVAHDLIGGELVWHCCSGSIVETVTDGVGVGATC